MTKRNLIILVCVLVLGLGLGYYSSHYQKWDVPPLPRPQSAQEKNSLIVVTLPKANQIVTSPLTISGQARGTWFFEASFPVRLLDGDGRELAVAPAQAQSNWMTQEFVPFVAQLRFSKPATATGTLVLEKDNPSGLAENADELRLPVRFE